MCTLQIFGLQQRNRESQPISPEAHARQVLSNSRKTHLLVCGRQLPASSYECNYLHHSLSLC